MATSNSDLIEPSTDLSVVEPGEPWIPTFIGICAGFAGTMIGYDIGIINGIIANGPWKEALLSEPYGHVRDLGSSADQEHNIIAMLSAGAFFGCVLSSMYADWLGRRFGMLVAICILCCAICLQLVPSGATFFLTGRFFYGTGLGILTDLVPLYQSEMSPRRTRGATVSSYSLFSAIGFLFGAILSYGVAKAKHIPLAVYDISLATQFVGAIILFLILYVAPETPQWFVLSGRIVDAERTLSCIRMTQHLRIRQEVHRIQAHNDFESQFLHLHQKFSHFDSFRRRFLGRQFTGMALHAFQQLSGINFILYYGAYFMQDFGVSNLYIASIAIAAFNLISTIPSLHLVNKFGRRTLLFWGAAGMAATQLLGAICGSLTPVDEYEVAEPIARKFAVVFMALFTFFYANTWGPLPWIISSEIYPLPIRGNAHSFASASHWFFHGAVLCTLPRLISMSNSFTDMAPKFFFVSAFVCVLAMLFVYYFVYETKDRSLDEISLMYESCGSARTSKEWIMRRIEQMEMSSACQILFAEQSEVTSACQSSSAKPREVSAACQSLFARDNDPGLGV